MSLYTPPDSLSPQKPKRSYTVLIGLALFGVFVQIPLLIAAFWLIGSGSAKGGKDTDSFGNDGYAADGRGSRRHPADTASTDTHPAALSVDKPTGVVIEARADPTIFPADWRSDDSTQAVPIRTTEIPRATRLMQKALRRYPPTFIQKNLGHIYLVSDLTLESTGASGTCAGRAVYVADDGKENDYDDDFLKGTLHHELAHLLFSNYAANFDADKWQALNPPGFEYGSGSTNAIKDGKDSEDIEPVLLNKGFVCQYATSELEEDFVCTAGQLMLDKTQFWHEVDHYPIMKKKVEIVVAFYHKIIPGFTEDYLRRNASDN